MSNATRSSAETIRLARALDGAECPMQIKLQVQAAAWTKDCQAWAKQANFSTQAAIRRQPLQALAVAAVLGAGAAVFLSRR